MEQVGDIAHVMEMQLCTDQRCGYVQPSGDTCGKCGAKTVEVSTELAIRFEPTLRLATKLEIECFGTRFAVDGRDILTWWHEIAIAYAAAAIDREMYPNNLLKLSPVCSYALLGEPGDISTFDGKDHTISIGIPSTGRSQTVYLLKSLFTDGTNTKDKAVYARCQELIGAMVKRAPSYHEFACYYRQRARGRDDREIARHLLAVIEQTENPADLVEALFLGACLGSEFLRNRTSYIDTLLCLKLVAAGALTIDQLIVGGDGSSRVKISELFAPSASYFPDLVIDGKYVLAAKAIRAARYLTELQLEPGTVAVKSTKEHNSSKTTTEANCWVSVPDVCGAFSSQDRWMSLSSTTCNPSQLGGALPMTGHNTQSLGSNALMVQLCKREIHFTQVQAKTVTNIVRMLHVECNAAFAVFFHGAFTRDVTRKITGPTSPEDVVALLGGFVRRQMVEYILGKDAIVPPISIAGLSGTPIQNAVEKTGPRFPDL